MPLLKKLKPREIERPKLTLTRRSPEKFNDEDYIGFLEGKFIGENIRLIDVTLTFPELSFFLDFGKAFYTIERSFMQKTFNTSIWPGLDQLD